MLVGICLKVFHHKLNC